MYRASFIPMTLLSLVACNGMSDEDYDDVATATAQLIADDGGEVDGMTDAVDTSTGQTPPGLTRASAGQWTGQRGDLSYSYELTCEDAAGQAQTECGPTTDRARLVVAWGGEVETDRRYASLDRTGAWTLSDLTEDIVSLNGTGRFAVDSEFEALSRPVMRSLSFDYSANYANVQYDRRIRRPVGGSIAYTVSAERTATRRFSEVESSFEAEVDVTFLPDDVARIEIDGERTYLVTLDDGTVVPE